MEQEQIIVLIHSAIMQILWMSLPLLGIGLVVGLVISIIQATTQINEQTIVFVAKILSVFLGMIIFGSWMLTSINDFTLETYADILRIIRS